MNAMPTILTASFLFWDTRFYYHEVASGEVTVYFPKGEKKFSVTKNAAEGAISVNVKSAKSISGKPVRIQPYSYVELDIDTGGAPKGEFLITAGGIEKAVEIVSAEDMPIPTPTPTPSSSSISSPSPSPIQHLHHRKSPSHFIYHALAPKRLGV